MNRKKIYISGGMTGIKNYNFLNFFRAERYLKKFGWLIYNPARMSFEYLYQQRIKTDNNKLTFKDINIEEFARQDCNTVIGCEAMYMLKDWEYSSGANTEWSLAKWLKKEIYYQCNI